MNGIAETQIQVGAMSLNKARMDRAVNAVNQTAPAKSADIPNLEHIEEAAHEFEAMFITEMLRPMFENIKPDPMFGGGKGEEVFQGMMLEQYGKTMADSGGIGIAKYVKAEMIRIQEEMQQ